MYIDEVAEICEVISLSVGMRQCNLVLLAPKNAAWGTGRLVLNLNVAHMKGEKVTANLNPESMKQTNKELAKSVSWK